jgi:ABC-type cobalamin/Fe3+-siderophores transport system ATPase subunit
VLLMDEPTASLDPARRVELAELLRSLVAGQERTLVVVTHDEDFAQAAANRLVVMRDGRVTEPL